MTTVKAAIGGIALAAVLLLGAAHAAHATNMVVNGDFEQTTMPDGSDQIRSSNLTGWSTYGYNFLFTPGAATSQGDYGPVGFWSMPSASPNGGNYIAADGAYRVDPLVQTINNLTPGAHYTVSFDWAAAQQSGFDGDTTEWWNVSLGSETHSTDVYSNPSHGVSAWMTASLDFTATSTSEVLSFLAAGTPNGEPPFSLLDGVSMTQASDVPEPASAALLLGGLAGLLRLRRKRRG